MKWECPKCKGVGCSACGNTGRYENYCLHMIEKYGAGAPMAVVLDLLNANLPKGAAK